MRFFAYPLQVKPLFREMVWGGRNISGYMPIPAGKKIGEAAFFCDNPSCSSVIVNGQYKGMKLSKYMEKFGMQAVGIEAVARSGRKFPLLVKFLDAKENLSVQVHPDEKAAAKLPGAHPKSEMWYVLGGGKKTCLYMGLKKKISTAGLINAAESGAVKDMLVKKMIKKGDAYFLKAGLVHAVGEGSLLLEIQQNSDTTYRLYDWGRKSKSGKPRPLHLKEAAVCAAAGFKPAAAGCAKKTKAGVTVRPLFKEDFFAASEISWKSGVTYMASGSHAFILAVLKGKAEIKCKNAPFKAQAGSVVFLPKNSAGWAINFGRAGTAIAAEIR